MDDFSIFMLIIMPATLLAIGGIVLWYEKRSDQKFDALVSPLTGRISARAKHLAQPFVGDGATVAPQNYVGSS